MEGKEKKKDLNFELKEILSKTMRSSFMRSQIQNLIFEIEYKLDKKNKEKYDREKVIELRKEIENIRKNFYGL